MRYSTSECVSIFETEIFTKHDGKSITVLTTNGNTLQETRPCTMRRFWIAGEIDLYCHSQCPA